MVYSEARTLGSQYGHELFLTFDIEDFISANSIPVLSTILLELAKYDLIGLFFITGHFAEKLQDFPTVMELLEKHQIGYHSSSHSVHPTIFESTDVRDYEEAYMISLHRETSHINPLSGATEGRGGILALRDIFPRKQIIAFRAPGLCWSPPHLQALKNLGITYDFSTTLSHVPINHNGITFYPCPGSDRLPTNIPEYGHLFAEVLKYKTVSAVLHPASLVNEMPWDAIYWKMNPKKLIQPPVKSPQETALLCRRVKLFFKLISDLQNSRIIEVTPNLEKPKTNLIVSKINIEKCYRESLAWANKRFNYSPKFLRSHFHRFFSSHKGHPYVAIV